MATPTVAPALEPETKAKPPIAGSPVITDGPPAGLWPVAPAAEAGRRAAAKSAVEVVRIFFVGGPSERVDDDAAVAEAEDAEAEGGLFLGSALSSKFLHSCNREQPA